MTALGNALSIMSPRRAGPPGPVLGANRFDLMSLLGMGLGETARTGRRVTREEAMKQSIVWRCVMLNSQVPAMLPRKVVRLLPDGGRSVETPAKARVLWGRPNPEVNASAFWTTAFIHYWQSGDVFLWVEFNEARVPVALWPVDPSGVRVGRDPKTGQKLYEIDHETVTRDVAAGGEMVHIMGPSVNGLRGLNPLQHAVQSAGISMAAEEFTGRAMGDGHHMDGYLSTEGVLTATEMQALGEAFDARNGGLDHVRKTPVFAKGVKWQQVDMDPEKLGLQGMRLFQASDLARFWGVPEVLLGIHDKTSSWGEGIANLIQGYLTFTLQPALTLFEREVSDVLLPRGLVMRFETGGLLRANLLDQAQRLEIEYRNGVRSSNEWRELLDMSRREDEGGDAFALPQYGSTAMPAAGRDGNPTDGGF